MNQIENQIQRGIRQLAQKECANYDNGCCLPDSLLGREYYLPTDQGLEYKFKDRLEQIKAWKKEHEKK